MTDFGYTKMLGLIFVTMILVLFKWIFENLVLHILLYIVYELHFLNIHFLTLSAIVNEVAKAKDGEEKWENYSGDLINCTM